MASAATDFDLVVAARGGDAVSFGELVRRHGPRLLALARQLVGAQGAEDVVQEAMIDAYRGLNGFAGTAAVGTWLFRITLNRALAERRKRRPQVIDAEPLDLLRRWEDPDYSVDPALVAARRSDARTVQALLDRLPETYRTAVVLHDCQALTGPEVAEAMGIPLATAKSHIRRGRMPCSPSSATTTEACWRRPDDAPHLRVGPFHGVGLHRRRPAHRCGQSPRGTSAHLPSLPAAVRLL